MGISSTEVIARLGPPERRENYHLSPDEGVLFLFYRTGPSELSSEGEDVGLTPVAIGKWGLRSTASNYYHSICRQYARMPLVQERS